MLNLQVIGRNRYYDGHRYNCTIYAEENLIIYIYIGNEVRETSKEKIEARTQH